MMSAVSIDRTSAFAMYKWSTLSVQPAPYSLNQGEKLKLFDDANRNSLGSGVVIPGSIAMPRTKGQECSRKT